MSDLLEIDASFSCEHFFGRAGIPCIIFPVIGDQAFWAKRCAVLGVGPKKAVSIKNLNADTLLSQLQDVLVYEAKEIASKAKALGEELRKEDGTKVAVDLIRKLFYWMKPTEPFADKFGTNEGKGIPCHFSSYDIVFRRC